MTEYTPDNWVVLKIKEGKGMYPFYKILAGWSGDYLAGDSWRMNSGITEVKDSGDFYEFYGESGSCYRCQKNDYCLRTNNVTVYTRLQEQQEFKGQVFMMPIDTNWLELSY